MLSPEPILDVVRGLSTVASFGIVYNQFFRLMEEIFTSECEFCRGAGRVICKHCRGTKTLRTRPGIFTIQRMRVVDRDAEDTYPCIYCGPSTKYDFDLVDNDNEEEAYNIMDNFKAAFANRRVPNPSPILAGTIPCPECWGNPVVYRHTPDFMRIAGQKDNFHFLVRASQGLNKTTMRRGIFRIQNPEAVARVRPHEYMEYPAQKPVNQERTTDTLIAAIKWKARKEARKARRHEREMELETIALSAKDQLTADDYILPYIDDNDSDLEDDW